MFKHSRKHQARLFLAVALGSMLLLYGIFYLFPIGCGLVGSFADWNPIKGEFKFIGLQNYIELLHDTLFWESVFRTMWFTVVCTLVVGGLGLLLAVLVHSVKRFQSFFKTCIYLPYITAIMSIAVVWRWIFLAQGGLLNNVLSVLGQQSVDWLGNSSTVMPSLMIMTIWHDVGYALILFIAGISLMCRSMIR